MTAKQKTAEESKEIALAPTAGALPDFLRDDQEVAGLGNSQDSSDSSLPFLGIIQSNSPQINESKSEYMEGAKQGMLFSKGLGMFWPARAAKGEDGLVVIPCGFQRNFVEWKPNRGGYADTHPYDLQKMRDLGARKSRVMIEGKEREIVTLKNGNQIVDTMYTFVMTQDHMPLIIGAASTAQGPMRDWMGYRKAQRKPGSGDQLPAFAKMYRLQTGEQTKDNNSWHNWKWSDVGFVTDETLYMAARKFAFDIAAGEVQIGRPDFFEDEGPTPDVPI